MPCTEIKEFTMATATARPATTELPDFAQKFREQLVSTVQQGQQLSLDVTQTWVKAVSVLPIPDLPSIPGVPAVPGVEAATKCTFDLANDLLNAQRDYAIELAKVFVPAKTA
jgi:hypothetical protein